MLEIKGNNFLFNGEKFNIYSGAIHYFRVPAEYWEDRLRKLKLAGFNTVETYVCWNLHEPVKGQFDYTGMLDISRFLKIAKEVGLYAIVRPGPYICAEWDFGGLPAWLLKDKNMRIRCAYQPYMSAVADFYKNFSLQIRENLISNGGNVIAMQVENEYGSYGNDKKYLEFIRRLMINCGMDTLLFTSDGNEKNMLSGGSLPDVFKVLNFGSRAKTAFDILPEFQKESPKMCGEFWCGWFDHWGEKHHVRNAKMIVKEIQDFLVQDASFNFYMFHGGTNFNFWAGANYHEKYAPTTTSYDYCALINEWGGYTPAYFAVRELMHKHQKLDLQALPEDPKLQNIGDVKLTKSINLMHNIDMIGKRHYSAHPEPMEYYGQNFGMILYRNVLKGNYGGGNLIIEGVHDIAYVFINGQKVASFDRTEVKEKIKISDEFDSFSCKIDAFKGELHIDILVEGMGRVNYGPKIYDYKGINNVRLGNQNLSDWTVYTLNLDNLERLNFNDNRKVYPMFFKGIFETSSKADCFVDMNGFTKGVVFVNGINLGRYWNKGPQRTLYLPGVWLKDKNEIIVLEQVANKEDKLTITNKHILNKKY